MSEQNKKIVRRTFDEVWNRGSFDGVGEIFASDFIGRSPLEEIHGSEGMKQKVVAMRDAFPDLHCMIEDQIAEGDRVVTRWTATGTHTGEFQGIPPTGKKPAVTGITIARLANGKVVEVWTNWDTMGLLQQLGALPAAEHALQDIGI